MKLSYKRIGEMSLVARSANSEVMHSKEAVHGERTGDKTRVKMHFVARSANSEAMRSKEAVCGKSIKDETKGIMD